MVLGLLPRQSSARQAAHDLAQQLKQSDLKFLLVVQSQELLEVFVTVAEVVVVFVKK